MSSLSIITIGMTFFSLLSNAQKLCNSEMNKAEVLYPYLGLNNLYGYSDSLGNVVIAPQYENTGFFHNGIALVNKEGEKEILINKFNELIPISLKYEHLNVYSVGDETVIETTHYYTNRWRFWDWEFLPGFQIIGGGSSDKRLFDTEVTREKHTLLLLERNKKIKVSKGERGDTDIRNFIYYLGGESVWINDELYSLKGDKIEKKARNVVEEIFLDSTCFLQKKGDHFRIIDKNGCRIGPKKLKLINGLKVNIVDKELRIRIEFNESFNYKIGDFYKDKSNEVYVFPDFVKAFPLYIQPYTLSETYTSETILSQAQSISSLPQTDLFLIVLNYGKNIFVLDSTGKWHSPEENYDKIRVVTRAIGEIICPPHDYFISSEFLPEDFKIHSLIEFTGQPQLIKVELKKDSKQLQGIWDTESLEWIMNPLYYSINFWSYQPPFVAFQKEEGGKWGFFDLENKSVHIEEQYEIINDGYWGSKNETSRPFYIDVETKKEFKEEK